MIVLALLAIPTGLALLVYGIATGDGHGVAFGLLLPSIGALTVLEENMWQLPRLPGKRARERRIRRFMADYRCSRTTAEARVR